MSRKICALPRRRVRAATAAKTSSSSAQVVWLCITKSSPTPEEGLGLNRYSVDARKSPYHPLDPEPPDLFIPTSLGNDPLPPGTPIFARRVYYTQTNNDGSHTLIQYFLPVENPYLV